ncbi:MAG: helix-turn-helix domain-containing protein [Pseudonocardiaceae bacterium]
MRDHEPTVRSRELGDGLRQAMQRARLNGRQAAHLLGWSPSWVSRLLSGKRNATELHVAAFLAVCRVTGAERDRLLALCQERHHPRLAATAWVPAAPTDRHPDRPRGQGGRDQRISVDAGARPAADR